MACGLWVLAGFLVFVVAEKMFSGVGNADDDDQEEHENEAVATMYPKKAKELENNNCNGQLDDCLKLGKNGFANGQLTKINGLNNGLRKVNGIDYKKCNGYANGFAKSNGVKNGFCVDARGLYIISSITYIELQRNARVDCFVSRITGDEFCLFFLCVIRSSISQQGIKNAIDSKYCPSRLQINS